MEPLHPGRDESADDTLQELWRRVQLIEFPRLLLEPVGVGEKMFDEAAPPEIAEQVVGVVLGLEVPLFALAVLQAEFTQDLGLPFRMLDHRKRQRDMQAF